MQLESDVMTLHFNLYFKKYLYFFQKETPSPAKKARTAPKRSPKSARKSKATPPKQNNKRKSTGSTPIVASTSKVGIVQRIYRNVRICSHRHLHSCPRVSGVCLEVRCLSRTTSASRSASETDIYLFMSSSHPKFIEIFMTVIFSVR